MTTANTGDPILDSLANYLQAQGQGTIGTNLFVHFMPSQIEQGIFLVNNIKGSQVDPYLPGYRRIKFRVVTRGATHPSALGQLNAILPYLEIDETALDFVFIKHMHYENDPIVFPKSYNSELLEASVILTATYYLTT